MKLTLPLRKAYWSFIFCCLSIFSVSAQVGINTESPDPGAMLDVESSTKGILIPRIDIPDLDEVAPVTGGSTQSLLVYNIGTTTQAGFYYWNVATTEWIALTPAEDGDFHQVGTSTVPSLITQDVYRTGKVAIGKTSASSALDVADNSSTHSVNFESTGSDNVLNVKRSGSKSGTARGIYVDYVNGEASSNIQQGIATYIRGGAGTGTRYGVYNNVQSQSGGSQQIYGTYNELNSGNGTGAHTGTYNRLGGNTSRSKTGMNNYITGTDNAEHIGVATNLSGTGTGNHTGIQNIVRGAGNLKGIYNTFNNASGNGENTGMETQNTNDGNGTQKGVHSRLDGDGTGEKIGNTNYITSENGNHTGTINVLKRDGNQSGTTGTGDKIGVFNNITDSEGDNYGVYNLITETVAGKTSYGSYTDINSTAGTNIGGYFTAHGVGATNYAAIFDEGNVGIGTDTPTEKLEVNGKIQAVDINFSGIPSYASNGAASSDAGLAVGDVYRVGNNLRIKL